MLANLLLFTYQNTSDDQLANEQPLIQVDFLRITSSALILGIIGAVITIPVNLLIVIIFSQRRHRKSESGEDATKKYRLEQRTNWRGTMNNKIVENSISRWYCNLLTYRLQMLSFDENFIIMNYFTIKMRHYTYVIDN